MLQPIKIHRVQKTMLNTISGEVILSHTQTKSGSAFMKLAAQMLSIVGAGYRSIELQINDDHPNIGDVREHVGLLNTIPNVGVVLSILPSAKMLQFT